MDSSSGDREKALPGAQHEQSVASAAKEEEKPTAPLQLEGSTADGVPGTQETLETPTQGGRVEVDTGGMLGTTTRAGGGHLMSSTDGDETAGERTAESDSYYTAGTNQYSASAPTDETDGGEPHDDVNSYDFQDTIESAEKDASDGFVERSVPSELNVMAPAQGSGSPRDVLARTKRPRSPETPIRSNRIYDFSDVGLPSIGDNEHCDVDDNSGSRLVIREELEMTFDTSGDSDVSAANSCGEDTGDDSVPGEPSNELHVVELGDSLIASQAVPENSSSVSNGAQRSEDNHTEAQTQAASVAPRTQSDETHSHLATDGEGVESNDDRRTDAQFPIVSAASEKQSNEIGDPITTKGEAVDDETNTEVHTPLSHTSLASEPQGLEGSPSLALTQVPEGEMDDPVTTDYVAADTATTRALHQSELSNDTLPSEANADNQHLQKATDDPSSDRGVDTTDALLSTALTSSPNATPENVAPDSLLGDLTAYDATTEFDLALAEAENDFLALLGSSSMDSGDPKKEANLVETFAGLSGKDELANKNATTPRKSNLADTGTAADVDTNTQAMDSSSGRRRRRSLSTCSRSLGNLAPGLNNVVTNLETSISALERYLSESSRSFESSSVLEDPARILRDLSEAESSFGSRLSDVSLRAQLEQELRDLGLTMEQDLASRGSLELSADFSLPRSSIVATHDADGVAKSDGEERAAVTVDAAQSEAAKKWHVVNTATHATPAAVGRKEPNGVVPPAASTVLVEASSPLLETTPELQQQSKDVVARTRPQHQLDKDPMEDPSALSIKSGTVFSPLVETTPELLRTSHDLLARIPTDEARVGTPDSTKKLLKVGPSGKLIHAVVGQSAKCVVEMEGGRVAQTPIGEEPSNIGKITADETMSDINSVLQVDLTLEKVEENHSTASFGSAVQVKEIPVENPATDRDSLSGFAVELENSAETTVTPRTEKVPPIAGTLVSDEPTRRTGQAADSERKTINGGNPQATIDQETSSVRSIYVSDETDVRKQIPVTSAQSPTHTCEDDPPSVAPEATDSTDMSGTSAHIGVQAVTEDSAGEESPPDSRNNMTVVQGSATLSSGDSVAETSKNRSDSVIPLVKIEAPAISGKSTENTSNLADEMQAEVNSQTVNPSDEPVDAGISGSSEGARTFPSSTDVSREIKNGDPSAMLSERVGGEAQSKEMLSVSVAGGVSTKESSSPAAREAILDSTKSGQVTLQSNPPLFPEKSAKHLYENPDEFVSFLSRKLVALENSKAKAHFESERSVFECADGEADTSELSPLGSPPVPSFDMFQDDDTSSEGSQESFSGFLPPFVHPEIALWDMVSERDTAFSVMEDGSCHPDFVMMPGDPRTPLASDCGNSSDPTLVSDLGVSGRQSQGIQARPFFGRQTSGPRLMRRLPQSARSAFKRSSAKRSRFWRRRSTTPTLAFSKSEDHSPLFSPDSDEPETVSLGARTVEGAQAPEQSIFRRSAEQTIRSSPLMKSLSSPDLLEGSVEKTQETPKNDRTSQTQGTPTTSLSEKRSYSTPLISQPDILSQIALPSLSHKKPGEDMFLECSETNGSLFRGYDDSRLEEELTAFSSVERIDFPLHYQSSDPVRYLASLRWQQLVSCWRHDQVAHSSMTDEGLPAMASETNDELDEQSKWSAHDRAAKDCIDSLILDGIQLSDDKRTLGGARLSRKGTGFVALSGFLASYASSAKDVPLKHILVSPDDATSETLRLAAESKVDAFSAILKSIIDFACCDATGEDLDTIDYTVSLKQIASIERKAKRNYGGDILQVKDVLRGSILFPSDRSLLCSLICLSQLGKNEMEGRQEKVEIVRVKNLFASSSHSKDLDRSHLPTGYRHVLVNVRIDGGILAGKWSGGLRALFLRSFSCLTRSSIPQKSNAISLRCIVFLGKVDMSYTVD